LAQAKLSLSLVNVLIHLHAHKLNHMAAKDRFHELVKQSLIQDNWIITYDPLLVRYDPTNLKVDLGAERVIGAQKNQSK
jgi:hypothetical protein